MTTTRTNGSLLSCPRYTAPMSSAKPYTAVSVSVRARTAVARRASRTPTANSPKVVNPTAVEALRSPTESKRKAAVENELWREMCGCPAMFVRSVSSSLK